MLQYMIPFSIKIQKPILYPYGEGAALSKQNPERKICQIFFTQVLDLTLLQIHAKIIKI